MCTINRNSALSLSFFMNLRMLFFFLLLKMSDPLTALMHAVQVMNLLKMLIMKTLREREEAASGGYSPMSSHSSDQLSDYNYDTQQEEIDTSGELKGGLPSDYEDDHPDTYYSEEEEAEEAGSLGEIEECFLRRLDETEAAPSGNSYPNQRVGREALSHENSSAVNSESGISFTDSAKNGSSLLTNTSDGEEDSRTSGLFSSSRISESKGQRKEFKLSCDEETGKSSPTIRLLI